MKINLSPLAVLSTALAVTACVALGYWQLDRAGEKRARAEDFRRGGETLIDATARTFSELAQYQAVSLRGAYEPGRQILLDNMPSADGQPGYRVLTPFRRAHGGTLLLVDRGWVPLGDSRQRLPAVDVAGGPRLISGRLAAPPAPGLRLGDSQASATSGWPRVMNFPTPADLAAVHGEPVEPLIVLLHPDAPDGFERKWQSGQRMGPERHLGYAIQWFALGVVLVLAILYAGWRRRAPGRGE